MSKDNTPAVVLEEKNITDNILNRINQMMSVGALVLPKDYSPENALKAAWFKLQETKTSKNDGSRPVLEVCSRESIANSLLKMVTNAWNSAKSQCYFIAYGTTLTCQGSYFGNKANARRVGMKDVITQVIYEGDDFEYEINPETGRTRVTKHIQRLENINMQKIKGGYATVIMEDGTVDVVIMTMQQVRDAWSMGQGEGPTHKKFSDMMVKKTISNRACRHIISTSNDADLYDDESDAQDIVVEAVHEEISSSANQQMIGHDEEVIVAQEEKEIPLNEIDTEPAFK